MTDPMLQLTTLLHAVYATLRAGLPTGAPATCDSGDRGAVSIEQVLWYAAAAVSVAVVAAIIWSQIRDTASTPVQAPSAP